jgi:predicted ATPase
MPDMSTAHSIRTPDQRLRIFVSSTLKELAPERRATRAALERLHLAPVMFELGARPHPPRELYRAYLDQSDVFLGIYWERYGWVAPDETVSGLEDEYNLCPPELPRLLYIKTPADNREPRLTELLDRIRDDDRAAFKYFETAKELAQLVQGDLATLLAERFEQSRRTVAVSDAAQASEVVASTPLPVPLTDLVGRDRELATIGRLLDSGTRMLTLTGPGGIGKSRLAIAAARAAAPSFADGTVFVDLSSVHDAAHVPNTIAQALGVRDTGDAPIVDKLEMSLGDRRILLVLDNFEQVLDAAPTVTRLLTSAPGLVVVVTSRSLLRVGGERSFEVGPLAVDSSVDLFVERAHAVKPDFEITPENAAAVSGICSAVDGVPLAIELAAARVRVLTPVELLHRLDRRLSLLVGGSRDLPERQQTLRRTIEWSTQLLDDSERRLLARLGVFEGGFTLDAAEFVGDLGNADPRGDGTAGTDAEPIGDVLTDLAVLVDNSLLSQHDRADHARFSMLAVVREYALEQLAAAGDLERVRDAHARYFIRLGDEIEVELEGSRQLELVRRLDDERDNLRAAERFLLRSGDSDRAAHLAWTLYVYWWVAGLLGEVRAWMDEVLESERPLSDLTRATALYFTRAITFWQDPDGSVAAGLTESAELFHRAGQADGEALALISLALAILATEEADTARADDAMETSLSLFRTCGDLWGESMALVMLGRVALLRQKVPAALNRFEESLAITRREGDGLGEAIAVQHLGWARLLLGDVPTARANFAECVTLSADTGHVEGVAYGLEGLVAVAALGGEIERAGRLAGAARALRERTGLYNAPAFTFHQAYLDQLVAAGAGEQVEAATAAGRELTVDEAVAEALAEPRAPGSSP